MAFTIEHFRDLIDLLEQHPEWRAELRRHVLSDDLLELPALVRQLVEAQARAEARLEGVEGRLDRVEVTLHRHTDQLGELQGEALELRYARRAPSYFGRIASRLRVVEDGPLADLLDDAVETGELTGSERDEILLADLVLTGRRRPDGQDVYVLAELSVGVGPHDVERAAARAELLAKLGKPVLPIVAGKSITEQAAAQAREQGVWYVEGGHVVPPRGA